MDLKQIMDSTLFITYGIPLLICLARITDVSLDTVRIIFVTKGLKYLAPILGFFEVSIWLLAISQVMSNIHSIPNFLAYVTGYSIGNYVGMYIENKLAIGNVVIRIITKRDSENLVEKLRASKYNVTVAEAESNQGAVNIIFTVVKRSSIKNIISNIHDYNPNAVYSIEDVRHAYDINFPQKTPWNAKKFGQLLRGIRR